MPDVGDARDWLEALAAAWRAERAAVRARMALERSGRMLAERVNLGIALSNLKVVDEQSAPGDRVRVRVAVPDAIDLDNLRIGPGDPVRLWAEHPDEPGAVRGVVERREEQSLWLMLDRPVEELDREYALDPEAPEVTFDRGDAAIEAAKDALATSDLARIRDVAALVRPAKRKPLSLLLAGGDPPGPDQNCAPFSDKDTNNGVAGWWFYLNFRATRVPWTEP